MYARIEEKNTDIPVDEDQATSFFEGHSNHVVQRSRISLDHAKYSAN